MKKLNNIITLVAKLLALRRVEVRLSIQLLFTVTVIMLCFNACRKKVEYRDNYITNTVVESHSWQQDNRFPDEQNYTGAYYYHGRALFTGEIYGDYTYDSLSKKWGVYFKDASATTKRIAVNKNFFCYTDGSDPQYKGLYFRDYYYFTSSYFVNYPIRSSFDTSFRKIPFVSVNYGSPFFSTIDISDSNRIVFPVVSTNTNVGYAVIDIGVTYTANPILKAYNKLNIKSYSGVNVANNPISYSPVLHIGNRFFIYSQDTTYLVRENLSIAKVLYPQLWFSSFFKSNNVQYAVVWGAFTGYIYKTLDDGETWTLEFTLNNWLSAVLNFDNKLIAIFKDQLFELTINGTQINFKELDNDGLKNKVITGLVKINSDVYISTNGGLFKRPYANFYTYK